MQAAAKGTWDGFFAGIRRRRAPNLRRHGVTCEEAASVFRDALSVTISELLHSTGRRFFVTIGRSDRNRTIVVGHSEVGHTKTAFICLAHRLRKSAEEVYYESL
jgi:hypothetical protein